MSQLYIDAFRKALGKRRDAYAQRHSELYNRLAAEPGNVDIIARLNLVYGQLLECEHVLGQLFPLSDEMLLQSGRVKLI